MFNSREYEFADVTVIVGGKDITGLRGVKYSVKQERKRFTERETFRIQSSVETSRTKARFRDRKSTTSELQSR